LQQYQNMYAQGVEANDRRYADLLNSWNLMQEQLIGQEGIYTQALDTYRGALADYERMQGSGLGTLGRSVAYQENQLGGAQQGWTRRFQDIMGEIGRPGVVPYGTETAGPNASFGAQAQVDLMNRYAGERAAAQQNLTNRGLSNTTVQMAAQRGLAQQETAELNRLRDDQLRTWAQQYGGLSADALSAQERITGQLAGAYADYAGAQERMGMDVYNARLGASDAIGIYGDRVAGIMQGIMGEMRDREDTYPTLGELSNAFLQFSYPQGTGGGLGGIDGVTSGGYAGGGGGAVAGGGTGAKAP